MYNINKNIKSWKMYVKNKINIIDIRINESITLHIIIIYSITIVS